jgi:hypothetical protein
MNVSDAFATFHLPASLSVLQDLTRVKPAPKQIPSESKSAPGASISGTPMRYWDA